MHLQLLRMLKNTSERYWQYIYHGTIYTTGFSNQESNAPFAKALYCAIINGISVQQKLVRNVTCSDGVVRENAPKDAGS